MKRLTCKEAVYSFSPNHPPALTIDPGEHVKFETMDCFSGQITEETHLVTGIDFNHVNPATGPVFIQGAEPGDALKVSISDLTVDHQGVVATLPKIGVLIHTVDQLKTRIVPIKDNVAHFDQHIKFPINPMIGVIGVAPKEGDIPCGNPGDHGGNMDNHLITANTTLYFPVNVPGALFGLGDLHASMGDGEICGTGIEIGGTVTAEFNVIKNATLKRPLLETTDKWYTIASAEDLDTAIRLGCEDMQKHLVDNWDLTLVDAYLLLSAIGDVEICQSAKPSPLPVVVRVGMPKLENKPNLIG